MNLESGLHFEQATNPQHYYRQMIEGHLVHQDTTCRVTDVGKIFVIDEAGLWLEATTYRRFRTAQIPPTRRLPTARQHRALAPLK